MPCGQEKLSGKLHFSRLYCLCTPVTLSDIIKHLLLALLQEGICVVSVCFFVQKFSKAEHLYISTYFGERKNSKVVVQMCSGGVFLVFCVHGDLKVEE